MDLPFWLTLGGKSSIHCAGGWLLLGTVAVLCGGVILGYGIIAIDWRKRELHARSNAGVRALGDLRNIFTYCMLAGYAFRVLMAFIPLWLPYLLVLLQLNWMTWRYIWRLKDLDIIYQDRELLEHIVNGHFENCRSDKEMLNAIRNEVREHLARSR